MNTDGLHAEVSRIMEYHYGRSRAITRRELRHILGITDGQDRKLRLVIADLRHEGLPILFATEKPAGYYLPESLAELQEGIRQLRSYIIDECIVLASFKHKGAQYVVGAKQGKLI